MTSSLAAFGSASAGVTLVGVSPMSFGSLSLNVAGATVDPAPFNNGSNVFIAVVPNEADLALTANFPPEPRSASVSASLALFNNGPAAASDVVVEVDVPSGLRFDPTASTSTCTDLGATLRCSFSSLPVFGFSTVELSFDAVSEATSSTGTARIVDRSVTDPVEVNDSATFATSVYPAGSVDLAVSLGGTVQEVGTTARIFIDVTNLSPGNTAADAVSVVTTLPSTFRFDGYQSSFGFATCSESGGVVTCSLPPIQRGSGSSLILEATALAPGQADIETVVSSCRRHRHVERSRHDGIRRVAGRGRPVRIGDRSIDVDRR